MWWHTWRDNAPTVLTTLTIGGFLYKRFIERPLRQFITDTVGTATKPIQPDANGGKSLPDVVVKLIAIETKIDAVDDRLRIVDKRLDRHIEQHVERGH